jgi:hypothetical protein
MTGLGKAGWIATGLLGMTLTLPAQEMERAFEELLQKAGKERGDAVTIVPNGGDMKVFSVVTDEGIVGLEVQDIYSNNASFFRVVEVSIDARKGGKRGGGFSVTRISGTNDPMRTWKRISGAGPISVESLVSASQAVALARNACQGVARVPDTVDGIVTETNGHYVITFPQKTEGGKFFARVKIEKKTGKVVEGVEVPD